MKPVVLYSSKGGNTKKIADGIASEVNCPAFKISSENSEGLALGDYDLIFVGTGIYWGNPIADMARFLESVNLEGTKRFAIFVTWGGAGKTDQAVITRLKTILKNKRQEVFEQSFRCFGGKQFVLSKKGHPNSEDIRAATQWAKSIVKSVP